jgi:cytochrome c peroxidase
MHQFQIGKDITDAEMVNMVAFLNTLTGEYNGKLLQ